MTTFHQDGTGFIAYTKGAPETVLDRCKWVTEYERRVAADKERPLAAIEAMASEGLRVLAVACRRWDELPLDDDPGKVEQDLTLLGLVGLLDPPRPEAKQAVATCKCAGITPVMITGDHAVTARAIAGMIGILGDDDTVLAGRELSQISDADLAERIGRTRIFARVRSGAEA